MFKYYGGKKALVKHYPTPIYDKIIEPFAGSAQYALLYWKKDVLLVDKDESIINMWLYMQNSSPKEILKFHNLQKGQNINELNLDKYEKSFLSHLTNLSGLKRNTITSLGYVHLKRQLYVISKQLYKIKHWNIIHDDYINMKNEQASWFIDPPYQIGGDQYSCSNKHINYNELANYCKTRKGQVIVCENSNCDNWLDFTYLTDTNGLIKKTHEVIWTNDENYMNYRKGLFN